LAQMGKWRIARMPICETVVMPKDILFLHMFP
jgi:hypothetical protein